MANYSITINSKFRPFSFQELMTPLMMMEQNHREVEEQYANLMTESAKWENLANEQTDKIAYNQYKRYALDLELAADKLAKEGITANSRPSMYKLKSRYNSEIAPIEAAYNLRAADIKAQNDFEAATGGQAIFTKRASTASLDDYLNGKPMDYGRTNLDAVQKEGMLGGAAISKRYIKTTEGKLFQNDYYDLVTVKGISEKQALDILNRSGKYPNFEKFINDTLAKHGYSNYSDVDKLKMESALLSGINLGLTYEETHAPQQNWRAKMDLGNQQAIQRMIAKYNLEHPDISEDPADISEPILPGQSNITGSSANYDSLRKKLFTKLGGGNSAYTGYNTANTAEFKKKLLKEVDEWRKTQIKEGKNPLEITREYVRRINEIRKPNYYSYAGKDSHGINVKPSNYINVMALYEEARTWANEHKILTSSSNNSDPIYGVEVQTKSLPNWAGAKKYIRDKYGVKDIISEKEYNQLASLGYTSKTRPSTITPKDFEQRVEQTVKVSMPSAVHSTNYKLLENDLAGFLAEAEASDNIHLHKVKNNKVETKDETSNIFKDANGKTTIGISEVAYSIENPDYIILRTRLGDYALRAGDIDSSLDEKIKNMKKVDLPKAKSNYQKYKLQEAMTREIRALLNSYYPTQGNTDSKMWNMSQSSVPSSDEEDFESNFGEIDD